MFKKPRSRKIIDLKVSIRFLYFILNLLPEILLIGKLFTDKKQITVNSKYSPNATYDFQLYYTNIKKCSKRKTKKVIINKLKIRNNNKSYNLY